MPDRRPAAAGGRARTGRLASGLVRVVLIGSTALGLAGCKENLYTQLSEADANAMLAILSQAEIDATRMIGSDGAYTIRVDGAIVAEAVQVLQWAGYPRKTYRNMGDVFAGDSFIMSPTEERARMVHALSEELSQTIADIDGIISARVHVVLPQRDILRRNDDDASASVVFKHNPHVSADDLLPQIKVLVANAIEGLRYEHVSVVPLIATRPGPGTEGRRSTVEDGSKDGGSMPDRRADAAAVPENSYLIKLTVLVPALLAYLLWLFWSLWGRQSRRLSALRGRLSGRGRPKGARPVLPLAGRRKAS